MLETSFAAAHSCRRVVWHIQVRGVATCCRGGAAPRAGSRGARAAGGAASPAPPCRRA